MFQLRNKISRTTVGKIPKSNFDACEDFLEVVIVSHILTAALEILEINNIKDHPAADVLGITSPEILWTCADEERKAVMNSVCEKIVDNFVKFSFTDSPKGSTDEVHNYACNLLSIGMFFLAYRDAIEEGDGERVLECWRYMLPLFHNCGRTNYANEAFILLCQYYFELPPQQA